MRLLSQAPVAFFFFFGFIAVSIVVGEYKRIML